MKSLRSKFDLRIIRRGSMVWSIARLSRLWIVLVALCVLEAPLAAQRATLRPADPIASIDGEPILLGELNYLLTSQLRVKDLSEVRPEVKQAASALLVRRHLAMKSLREQGGAALTATLDRQWEAFLEQLRRNGIDLEQYCKQKESDERSVRQSNDWDSAWRIYLKSRMTDANLKRYYQLHPEKYAQTRWDVSHLFIAVDRELPDAKAISEQRINAIAADLQTQQLESREKLAQRFAELARRESEGATAKDGGRIGWVSKPGDLPKSVLDAIRVTDQGTVSQVVLSPLGYHLVLVHDKTILEVPFEQVQDLGPLRRDAADALFEGLISLQRDAKVAWYLNELRPPVSSPPDSHLPSGGQASP